MEARGVPRPAAAIVSEPLHFAIPESLDGVATFFETIDECVAACETLLGDNQRVPRRPASDRLLAALHSRPRTALVRRRLTEEFAA